MFKHIFRLLLSGVMLLCCLPLAGQYTDGGAFKELGGAEEFGRRRQALCDELKTGFVLLFANVGEPLAGRYSEDNDFYYFTGVADPGAVFLMNVERRTATLFEPEQDARSRRYLELNLLSRPKEERDQFGFQAVMPLPTLYYQLNSLLAGKGEAEVWMRLGYADNAGARSETGGEAAAGYLHPFGRRLADDRERIKLLRDRWPAARLRDLTPAVDKLRNIKTAAETEVLRRNGRLSAEGIRRAIAHAMPGMFEYQVAAVATHVFSDEGAQGVAYNAIVGSGPNSNVWHYSTNRRKMQAGEVVVFDYAAELDKMAMDITRTFPVDGKFTPEQAKWYEADLEAQKAMIAALKPGMTYEQVGDIGRKIYEKHGVGNQWRGFAAMGHFVGLAVHDVLVPAGPVKAGQVVTVEPMIEFPDRHLHIRIEDTILVTESGPEVLTSGAPKEMAEIEKLVGSEK